MDVLFEGSVIRSVKTLLSVSKFFSTTILMDMCVGLYTLNSGRCIILSGFGESFKM